MKIDVNIYLSHMGFEIFNYKIKNTSLLPMIGDIVKFADFEEGKMIKMIPCCTVRGKMIFYDSKMNITTVCIKVYFSFQDWLKRWLDWYDLMRESNNEPVNSNSIIHSSNEVLFSLINDYEKNENVMVSWDFNFINSLKKRLRLNEDQLFLLNKFYEIYCQEN